MDRFGTDKPVWMGCGIGPRTIMLCFPGYASTMGDHGLSSSCSRQLQGEAVHCSGCRRLYDARKLCKMDRADRFIALLTCEASDPLTIFNHLLKECGIFTKSSLKMTQKFPKLSEDKFAEDHDISDEDAIVIW